MSSSLISSNGPLVKEVKHVPSHSVALENGHGISGHSAREYKLLGPTNQISVSPPIINTIVHSITPDWETVVKHEKIDDFPDLGPYLSNTLPEEVDILLNQPISILQAEAGTNQRSLVDDVTSVQVAGVAVKKEPDCALVPVQWNNKRFLTKSVLDFGLLKHHTGPNLAWMPFLKIETETGDSFLFTFYLGRARNVFYLKGHTSQQSCLNYT